MTSPSVLIVEDDHELRSLLSRGLVEEGFDAEGVANAADGLERVERNAPDALVIDIGLPDADGRDLCQALRARGISVPVLFLTARDALVDRLSAFDAGGDDYVAKPFELAEVAARLQALLRRAGHTETVALGPLRVDPVRHTVSSGETEVSLTPTELRLLSLLVAHGGAAVRRGELVRAGWVHGAHVRENTLDAYVARLRRKLRELPDGPQLTTVHGVGYRLE